MYGFRNIIREEENKYETRKILNFKKGKKTPNVKWKTTLKYHHTK